MTVRAYTTGDQLQLLLNDTRIGTVSLAEDDERIATFTVPYAPGELTAVAYRGGEGIARKTIVTAGAPARLKLTSDVPGLTTGRDDLAHVMIEVVDADGRLVPDALVEVSVGVTGGELAGLANGNPHNPDSFKRPRHWTYRGAALAILRPPKEVGTIVFQASADGLERARIELPVRDTPVG